MRVRSPLLSLSGDFSVRQESSLLQRRGGALELRVRLDAPALVELWRGKPGRWQVATYEGQEFALLVRPLPAGESFRLVAEGEASGSVELVDVAR